MVEFSLKKLIFKIFSPFKIKSRPKKSHCPAYSKYVEFGIAIGAYTDAEWTLRPPPLETLRPT